MKEEYIAFMEKVADMRRAQRAYFDARKRNDFTMAPKFLEQSKSLEREVDQHIKQRRQELVYGEQKNLFT